MNKYWNSQEEVDKLIFLYTETSLTINQIAIEMKRSTCTIKRKIKNLNLKRPNEIKILIKSNSCSGEKNGMFGKSNWRKGQTKENNEKVKLAGEKCSITRKDLFKSGKIDTKGEKNGMFGKHGCWFGQTKENNKKIKLASIKISNAKKEYWKNLSIEIKEERKTQLKEARKCARRKSTIPENIIETWLVENNINYKKQVSINVFIIDFTINDNLIVECLGDYWHSNPLFYSNKILTKTQINNNERDERKIKYFKDNSINYILLWENDIKRNFGIVEKQLLALINN